MKRIMVAAPFSGFLRPEAEGGNSFREDMRARIEQVHGTLSSAGYEVLSAHVAEHYGRMPWADQFVERDLNWVDGCAAQVVLLPMGADGAAIRSDGSMIELGFALARGKPVVLLAEGLDHSANSYFLRSLPERDGLRAIEWEDGYEPRLIEALKDLLRETPKSGEPRQHRSDVDGMLADIRKETEPHEVVVGDLKLTVFTKVLSPRYSHSPDLLISKWHIPRGARVLDIGCGCGVLGIAALKNGAAILLAIDINENAVANTEFNARSLGYSDRAEARRSDTYASLRPDERFDVILFAAPYWDRAAHDVLERSCFDEDYRFFKAAVSGADRHLAENGVMYVLFSDQGDVNRALALIAEAKMAVRKMHLSRASLPADHTRILWELVPIKD